MRVIIKSLKRLRKEYGSPSGDINCECTFTQDMEARMPSNRTIFVFKRAQQFWAWKTSMYTFSISEDMIESILVE